MGQIKIKEDFAMARWCEPIIYEMSRPNVRALFPPRADEAIVAHVGDVSQTLPDSIKRKEKPGLPELSQKAVLSHFLRLSQMCLGSNFSNDISSGTCTMKYNPRVNEKFVSLEKFSELHPMQSTETVQGILKIYYDFEKVLKEISGLDHFSMQPSGGSHAIYTAACVMREYWKDMGQADTRDEIITTVFSHPANAACAHTAGFKIITIFPNDNGLPDKEAFLAAISERTAGILITNPEDLGMFTPYITDLVDAVHAVGGLCFYDQANANGFLGITRAKEAGFDMCHFNLHKTFGSPHASSGPALGALGCVEKLLPYMPVPHVVKKDDYYDLDFGNSKSIGKVRDYLGVAGVVLRSYAWVAMLGAEGLRECASISVLNNNYMEKQLKKVRGLSGAYEDNGLIRQEQIRYSWEQMKKDTGLGVDDVARRVIDYSIPTPWQSHHPFVIPEPMTLEPCESYSIDDIDEYVEVLQRISDEAYTTPEIVESAPHNCSCHKKDAFEDFDDPEKWATTWQAWKRKHADR